MLAACSSGGTSDGGGSSADPDTTETADGSAATADDEATASGSPDREAWLRLVAANAPQSMDPVREVSPCSISELSLIYDTLIRMGPDGELVPGLASEWASPDPTTLVLTLQEDVTFQNGEPFDAYAVAAHFDRAINHPESAIAGGLGFIDSVEATDDTTVTINLNSERAGVLTSQLTEREGMVPSPTAVEAAGDEYGATSAVGAGPYRYVENIPNDYFKVEAWDGYWDPESQLLAGVEHNGFPEDFQIERIRSGELNYVAVFDQQIQQVEEAAEEGLVEYHVTPVPQVGEIFINYGNAPFDDVLVRRALNHAVDRELMADVVTSGTGTPAWSILPSTSWAHTPAVEEMYPYDPEEARSLLEEAGYPDGLELTVGFVGNPYYQASAEALQAMLSESGFELSLESVPPAEINNALYARQDYDIAVTAFLGHEDPGITLERKYSTDGVNNPSGNAPDGLDELLAAGAAETGIDARAPHYQEALELVMENALAVPLYTNAGVVAHVPEVKGVVRGYTTCQTANYLTPGIHVTE